MADGLSVLVVDDETSFRQLIERQLERRGVRVVGAASGEEALERLTAQDFDVAILDIAMPGMSGVQLLEELKALRPLTEAIMMTGHGTVSLAVEAMRLGAYDFLEKPLRMSELVLRVEKAAEKRRLARENVVLKSELKRREPDGQILGTSAPIAQVRALIDTYAAHDSPVLILGQSGTGKELVARAVHQRGKRAGKAFVAINCGALQESLLENELFGHRQGAFTGALSDRPGLFEAADQGTLFIDEVCEMDLGLQKKFLRVLEDGVVRRLGDTAERKVSVRIVAATNKDMELEVREARFREDLYYRLNVLTLRLPPLRERGDDVTLLANAYVERFSGRTGKPHRLAPAALAKLRAYPWPGNVRELFNVLERALIICTDGLIQPDDLSDLDRRLERAREVRPGEERAAPADTLEETEKRHILRALEETGGNKTRAAEKLGISLRSLYRKLARFGIG